MDFDARQRRRVSKRCAEISGWISHRWRRGRKDEPLTIVALGVLRCGRSDAEIHSFALPREAWHPSAARLYSANYAHQLFSRRAAEFLTEDAPLLTCFNPRSEERTIIGIYLFIKSIFIRMYGMWSQDEANIGRD